MVTIKDGITDKYCIVWEQYKYKDHAIKVYFNGHSSENWGHRWEFIFRDNIVEPLTIDAADYLDVAMFGLNIMAEGLDYGRSMDVD